MLLTSCVIAALIAHSSSHVIPHKCPQSKAYWAADDKCYEINSRGPCSRGQVYARFENTGKCIKKKAKAIVFKSKEKCDDYSIWWPQSGSCERLLTRGPCSEGEWLALNVHNQQPKGECQKRPCPKGQALWPKTNTCYQINNISEAGICPEGHDLQYTHFGTGVCNCKPGYFVWSPGNNCYPGYRQGPCVDGYMIAYINLTYHAKISCIQNPCKVDGEAPWIDGHCYKLGSTGPCLVDEVFQVNPGTGQLDCVRVATRFIITTPVVASLCNPGTFLTGFGICRAAVTVAASTLFKLFG